MKTFKTSSGVTFEYGDEFKGGLIIESPVGDVITRVLIKLKDIGEFMKHVTNELSNKEE